MNSQNPVLPEPVAVALSSINWADGLDTLNPLTDALIDASRECELPAREAIFDAMPPAPTEIWEQADTALHAAYNAAIDAVPIMRTFVRARPAQMLGKLAELSFVAGRAGDDRDAWHDEMIAALTDGFRFENTPEGPNRSSRPPSGKAIAALERAFQAGCAQREIDAATPVSRLLSLARAHALIYADEISCPADLAPCWVESAVARTAFRIASRHAVTAAEAALVAIEAFRAEGMAVPLTAAALALDRGRLGESERTLAEAEAKAREAAAADQLAALFAELSETYA